MLLNLLFIGLLYAKPTIVVLDAGFDIEYLQKNSNIIAYAGFGDYTKNKTKHGTEVVEIIQNGLKKSEYDLILIEWQLGNVESYFLALEAVATQTNAIVNLSIGGSDVTRRESVTVKKIIERDNTLVIAAGNGSKNLDESCNEYPACHKLTHPSIVVVGMAMHKLSNYGKIVDEYLDGYTLDKKSKGTSFAVPRKVVKIIKEKAHVK